MKLGHWYTATWRDGSTRRGIVTEVEERPHGVAVVLRFEGDAPDDDYLFEAAGCSTATTWLKRHPRDWRAWGELVKTGGDLERHAYNLFEWSHVVDFMGLPTHVWVVREMLKTEPAFEAFNGFPVTREFRWFVRDGRVTCRHPYWPPGAIEGHTSAPDWAERLARLNEESPADVAPLGELSERVARAVPGFWSVDWLWTTDRGWVLTDMAEGEKSYHWPGCANGGSDDA